MLAELIVIAFAFGPIPDTPPPPVVLPPIDASVAGGPEVTATVGSGPLPPANPAMAWDCTPIDTTVDGVTYTVTNCAERPAIRESDSARTSRR